MTRYRFERPARAALLAEMRAAGFSATTPEGTARVEMDERHCYVWCEPGEEFDRAAAVVAAHDAAAHDAREEQARQAYLTDLAILRNRYRNAAATPFEKALCRLIGRLLSEAIEDG